MNAGRVAVACDLLREHGLGDVADYLVAAHEAGTTPAPKPVSVRVLPSGIGFFHGNEVVGQVFEMQPHLARGAEGHVLQHGARVLSLARDSVDDAVEAVRYALEQLGYGPLEFEP